MKVALVQCPPRLSREDFLKKIIRTALFNLFFTLTVRMKKILFRLLALLIGIGITLISLELFLRINPKFGYIYNSFRFKSDKLAQEDFTRMRPSDLLAYEHIPNCDSGINSYGLVGKEYKLEKDKNIFRILILGDSIAEQGYSGEFLENNLNSNPKLHLKYTFEVWNAGVASYDVRRYAVYLKHKGLHYNPDMVIIFLFMNDFELNTNIYYKTKDGHIEYHFPISEISKIYIPNKFLMMHSYLYRFIILRSDSFLMSKRKIQGVDPREEDGRYYLKIIKQICQERNIPLLLVVFPYLKPLNEYDSWQFWEYKTIFKVIKDLKINYFNPYEQLSEKDLIGLKGSKEDEIHPSFDGHYSIAKIIYDYLLDNLFIWMRS